MSEPVSNKNTPVLPDLADSSCRLPLFILFVSGAIWLLVASGLSFLASLKFHAPNLFAEQAWLTYGRLVPAARNALLFGFCLQAGLGVVLWLLTHLGRTVFPLGWLAVAAAALYNLGLTIGLGGILTGDSTGFDTLELPGYATPMIFLGYLALGLCAAVSFHNRRERPLYVTQWFFLAGLLWFPWIYATAELFLVRHPVRGMAQAVLAWWFADNFQVVWCGLIGLGVVFYLVPKISGRELYSRNLAIFVFWMLILFASWGGIPHSAPVPAWLPVLSAAMTVLASLMLIVVAMSYYQTLGRALDSSSPSLLFVGFGVGAFLLAGVFRLLEALPAASAVTELTWFTPATTQLQTYGFFSMVLFGAIYFILPRLAGLAFPAPGLVRAHFWLAALGVILYVLPLAIGGVVEGANTLKPDMAWNDVVKGTLMFLRVSTLGEVLLILGHLVFLLNVVGLVNRYSRAKAEAAFADATADLFKAAPAKP